MGAVAENRPSLDDRCINTIRCLSIDAIQKAKSGHPGAPMGLAPAGYVLWTKILKHHPGSPDWRTRLHAALQSAAPDGLPPFPG